MRTDNAGLSSGDDRPERADPSIYSGVRLTLVQKSPIDTGCVTVALRRVERVGLDWTETTNEGESGAYGIGLYRRILLLFWPRRTTPPMHMGILPLFPTVPLVLMSSCPSISVLVSAQSTFLDSVRITGIAHVITKRRQPQLYSRGNCRSYRPHRDADLRDYPYNASCQFEECAFLLGCVFGPCGGTLHRLRLCGHRDNQKGFAARNEKHAS